MKIGSKLETHLKLGNMNIEEADKYKHLGETMNNRGNMEDHIHMIEGKVDAAYQTILYIAKDNNFKFIKMGVM